MGQRLYPNVMNRACICGTSFSKNSDEKNKLLNDILNIIISKLMYVRNWTAFKPSINRSVNMIVILYDVVLKNIGFRVGF